jgi:4a-hydroxytetrahydrobiopterin dehydratase
MMTASSTDASLSEAAMNDTANTLPAGANPAADALAAEALIPCTRETPTLQQSAITALLATLADWSAPTVDGVPRLVRTWRFSNFRQALAFANHIGELAEAAGHHPALLVEWGRVTVSWWTHDIGGLHRNDFILAARTNRLALPSSQ